MLFQNLKHIKTLKHATDSAHNTRSMQNCLYAANGYGFMSEN